MAAAAILKSQVGLPVAQTCCIGQCAKYGKSGILATSGSKTPVPITMKLGVRNYVRDPTSASKYGNDRAAWGVSAHARNITVTPFFFSFLHLAYRSPQWTNFHDLYARRRVFAHGSAFWGSRWWIFTFTPFLPQNLKICITASGNFERQ